MWCDRDEKNRRTTNTGMPLMRRYGGDGGGLGEGGDKRSDDVLEFDMRQAPRRG